jgi:cytochrome c553
MSMSRGYGALVFAGLLGVASTSAAEEPSDFDVAMGLQPDLANGAELYRKCVSCHGAEGWGDRSGSYPQIAGQLSSVVIKQLADIRAGNRDNPIMRAFSSQRALGDAQDIADVAAYIEQMPMTNRHGKAPGADLAHGKKVYEEECADCHGSQGEGDRKKQIPALRGQHYHYMVRQFNWIRNGRRRNADPDMVEQIQRFKARDVTSVMAYAASLPVPAERVAPPGWTNPDFPQHWRGWRPLAGSR